MFDHINMWHKFFPVIYPLFIYLPHYLCQLLFFSATILPPPRPGQACALPLTTYTHYPASVMMGQYWFLFCTLLFRIWICSYFLYMTITLIPGVGHFHKFLIPPIIPYFPPSTSLFCCPFTLLIPTLYHIPFLCASPKILHGLCIGPPPPYLCIIGQYDDN